MREEPDMNGRVVRMLVALAAVSMAASGATAAERVMLNEQFTATW